MSVRVSLFVDLLNRPATGSCMKTKHLQSVQERVSRHVSPPLGEPRHVSPGACEPRHVSPAAWEPRHVSPVMWALPHVSPVMWALAPVSPVMWALPPLPSSRATISPLRAAQAEQSDGPTKCQCHWPLILSLYGTQEDYSTWWFNVWYDMRVWCPRRISEKLLVASIFCTGFCRAHTLGIPIQESATHHNLIHIIHSSLVSDIGVMLIPSLLTRRVPPEWLR